MINFSYKLFLAFVFLIFSKLSLAALVNVGPGATYFSGKVNPNFDASVRYVFDKHVFRLTIGLPLDSGNAVGSTSNSLLSWLNLVDLNPIGTDFGSVSNESILDPRFDESIAPSIRTGIRIQGSVTTLPSPFMMQLDDVAGDFVSFSGYKLALKNYYIPHLVDGGKVNFDNISVNLNNHTIKSDLSGAWFQVGAEDLVGGSIPVLQGASLANTFVQLEGPSRLPSDEIAAATTIDQVKSILTSNGFTVISSENSIVKFSARHQVYFYGVGQEFKNYICAAVKCGNHAREAINRYDYLSGDGGYLGSAILISNFSLILLPEM